MDMQPVNGYIHPDRTWMPEDKVTLSLDMPTVMMRANPRVYEDIGRVAVMRGPLVYCPEETDNGKGLHRIHLDEKSDFEIKWQPELLNGIVTIESNGVRETDEGWKKGSLYAEETDMATEPVRLRWISYYAWAIRGVGEMRVWVQK